MRFKRYGWFAFQDTRRKRLAYDRKMRRERAALPLFAELIGKEQTPVDVVMRERSTRWDESQRQGRRRRAARWREARRSRRAHAPSTSTALRAYWQRRRYLADAEYLMSMLQMFERGDLDIVAGPTGRSALEAQERSEV